MTFLHLPRLAPRDQRPRTVDFAKLIKSINARLVALPLDLRPAPKVDLEDAGRSGNVGVRRLSGRGPWSEFQAVVQKMTNHQRHQWARAGYPGLRHKDVKALRRFTNADPS